MNPDPAPRPRIRNPVLLGKLHQRWRECVLCGETWPLSLHHVHKHPRDDVQENLVMVCGSGTTLCHGKIEAHDPDTLRLLGGYITADRPDILAYLTEKLKGAVQARAWIEDQLLTEVAA